MPVRLLFFVFVFVLKTGCSIAQSDKCISEDTTFVSSIVQMGEHVMDLELYFRFSKTKLEVYITKSAKHPIQTYTILICRCLDSTQEKFYYLFEMLVDEIHPERKVQVTLMKPTIGGPFLEFLFSDGERRRHYIGFKEYVTNKN